MLYLVRRLLWWLTDVPFLVISPRVLSAPADDDRPIQREQSSCRDVHGGQFPGYRGRPGQQRRVGCELVCGSYDLILTAFRERLLEFVAWTGVNRYTRLLLQNMEATVSVMLAPPAEFLH